MLKEDIINNYEQEIYESYEGTTLTVFNFNNKWYLSTRKELDAKKSIWKGNKSYYNLFCETVNCKFDEFTKNLKKEYYYFFVLIHNENKNIVDYTEKFGINYKEVIHIMTRKSNNHEEIKLDDKNQFKNNMNLKISKKLKSLDTINELNNKTKLSLPIKNEGVIIKLTNKLTKKTNVLKYHTNSYKILSKLKPNHKDVNMMIIDLYKKDFLKEHLIYFPENTNITLIMNNGRKEEFDTIKLIDALFKILTSELFELFKILYDLKNCSQKNSNLYNELPNPYKIILYKIRGIYFKKRRIIYNKKKIILIIRITI